MITLEKARNLAWSYGQWLNFGLPTPWAARPALTDRASEWLINLERDGILRIELPAFAEVARHVEKTYFEGEPHAPLFAHDTNTDLYRSFGIERLAEVSFKDPGLLPLLLHEELHAVYFHYYGRQPYFRNHPVVQRLSYREGQPKDTDHGNRYHTDPLRQLSLMLLVSDAPAEGGHMVYAAGSHRRPMWRTGIYIPYDVAEAIARRSAPVSLTGAKGTLFLFDASGVHRRILRPGARHMLHLNLTTGHHRKPIRETFDGWSALQNIPNSMRRMFLPAPRSFSPFRR
jgi:hypothetical protein